MEKQMKTKSKISGYIVRSAACAVFLSAAFIALSSAFDSTNSWCKWAGASGGYDTNAKTISQPRAITFAERVAYQRAIEHVYWRHRIWPKENHDPKPSFDAVMSQAQLENKVAEYLRDSQALEDNWQKPITAEQLQAEMDRMARDTKQPEVLRELFEALGNDPAIIAECLARPVLAERLIADLSTQDKTGHFESPWTDGLDTIAAVTTLGRVFYTLPDIADAGDPLVDTWTPTSTANAPSARGYHTAVWTGVEMIVWGGYDGTQPLNTGARYNPSTDSWTATSIANAPAARAYHNAVWTGTYVGIWGGYWGGIFGGRYDPLTDLWEPMSTVNEPPTGRLYTGIWTAGWAVGYMGVWGGQSGGPAYLNVGGLYDPSGNIWTTISNINSPEYRQYHTAVWTGGDMIIWGGAGQSGALNTGGRYNLGSNSWTATTAVNAPLARQDHTAVWTDSEMIVWGGGPVGTYFNTGGRYNPGTDTWTATSTTNAPDPRHSHTTVWTGSEMIVWGGNNFPVGVLNTGGRYNPSSESWTATSITNAPSARVGHTAVWTGSYMIIWGGTSSVDPPRSYYNTGGSYYPGTAPSLHPAFCSGEVSLGNGVYYLQFPNGTPFGYYSYLSDPRWIYHFDMGYEYWFDANDGQSGIYFYDNASTHFFYTSPSFPFPYLYDFSLNTVLYYYPDTNNPGHYTTNPRYFYNFATGQIITM
jgi:N-acetylneuraminic acid mutarotase